MRFPIKVAASCVAMFALANVAHEAPPPGPQSIEILASRYSFRPSEITVKRGVPVTIAIHALDATHGLVIEEFRILAEVRRGETQVVRLVPSTAGTFQGRCAHFCGRGHRAMTFKVHVVE